jgi:hypothetical protein
MSGLSVSENIKVLEDNARKLNDQIASIQQELVRIDGSLRVFKSLADLGIEQIPLPKDVVDNSEVIDSLE